MAKQDVRLQRVDHANQVLLVMATHGRKFFYSQRHHRVAVFSLDRRGWICFADDHYAVPFRVLLYKRWPFFVHGGTLRSLVEALTDYIRTGKPMAAEYFGPWPHCRDLWGYGADEMILVRAKLASNPAVAKPTPAPALAAAE